MGTRNAPRSKAKAKRTARLQRMLRTRATTGGNSASNCGETAAAGGELLPEDSTVKQVAAAACILGQSVSKTAEALGVDRRTLQRWSKFDPEFQEAMAEAKQELVVTSRQSLLAVSEAAVELVETKLGAEKCTKIALAFLRGVGVFGPEAEMSPAQLREMQTKNGAQSATFAPAPGSESAAGETTEDELPSADIMDSLPEDVDSVYEFADLPAAQQEAAMMIYNGKTINEVANFTVTSAATIRNWLCYDLRFFTVLQKMQFERITRLKYRLLRLMDTAVQLIRHGIVAGDARLALAMLRGLKLLK